MEEIREEILPDPIVQVPYSEEIKILTLENPVLINPTIIGGHITNATVTRYVKITSGIFGGDGTDGDLIITSGTTTLDLGSAQFFIKNYKSIEISGTGKLAFSNPHANGTLIILKSQGAVILTSSTNPCIDCSGLGAVAVTNGTYILDDSNHYGVTATGVAGGAGGAILATKNFYSKSIYNLSSRSIHLACGSGGGNGMQSAGNSGGGGGGGGAYGGFGGTGGNINTNGGAGNAGTGASAGGGGAAGGDSGAGVPGTGGRGGGTLLIECAGDLNFTGTISVAGLVGGSSTLLSGAGGGGAGGMILILYNSATSTAGTLNTIGGAGGDTNIASGGAGGASDNVLHTLNNYF